MSVKFNLRAQPRLLEDPREKRVKTNPQETFCFEDSQEVCVSDGRFKVVLDRFPQFFSSSDSSENKIKVLIAYWQLLLLKNLIENESESDDFLVLFKNIKRKDLEDPYLIEKIRDLFSKINLPCPDFDSASFCAALFRCFDNVKAMKSSYEQSLEKDKKEMPSFENLPELIKHIRYFLGLIDLCGSERDADKFLKDNYSLFIDRKEVKDSYDQAKNHLARGSPIAGIYSTSMRLGHRQLSLLEQKINNFFYRLSSSRVLGYIEVYDCRFKSLVSNLVNRYVVDFDEKCTNALMHWGFNLFLDLSFDIVQALFQQRIFMYYGLYFNETRQDFFPYGVNALDKEKSGFVAVLSKNKPKNVYELELILRSFLSSFNISPKDRMPNLSELCDVKEESKESAIRFLTLLKEKKESPFYKRRQETFEDIFLLRVISKINKLSDFEEFSSVVPCFRCDKGPHMIIKLRNLPTNAVSSFDLTVNLKTLELTTSQNKTVQDLVQEIRFQNSKIEGESSTEK